MLDLLWKKPSQAGLADAFSQHLPAWKSFNRSVGTDGSVGIWHETYSVAPGTYENVYANMPPFGLGKAGILEKAHGKRESARGRLQDGT